MAAVLRNILAALLLVGTGGLFIKQMVIGVRDETLLLFMTLFFSALFFLGVYYHIKDFKN